MGTPPSYRRSIDKKLLSHEKDNIDLSIMMVKVRKGMEVQEHVHEQNDIIYQLEGTCKMWVDGAGDFQLHPGSFLRIPAGVKHQPHDIKDDVLAFDIFLSHLFSFFNFRLREKTSLMVENKGKINSSEEVMAAIKDDTPLLTAIPRSFITRDGIEGYRRFANMKYLTVIFLILVSNGLIIGPVVHAEREIREYQGKPLDPFDREYDNSIRGPQHVDIETYRLEVTGLVQIPQSLTYQEVLRLPIIQRAVTLHCVEGWDEHLLFEGVRLADLLAMAKPRKGVRTVIFYAADGYSSSLSYDDVIRLDVMLAAKINGRDLDANRGFPFQVVAESKLGYKWVKWVTRIELSENPYKGFWEQRGYDNEADVKK